METTTKIGPIAVASERLAAFCRRWRIVELALFGSALRDDFGPESDVDLLVTFAPGARVSLMALGRMAQELEAIFGRTVDLVPKEDLKPLIRGEVSAAARVLYAA